MSKIMQNLVVFMEPMASEHPYITPLKAGNMILNRFCIDEDAAFELSGVNYLKKYRKLSDTEKGKEYSENCIHSYSKLNFHEHLVILQKEHFDEEVITAALQKISENEAKELKIHFVYAGYYYFYHEDKLRSIILNGMKKHKIKSVMLTSIYLQRVNLITKEEMESYCKGEKDEKDSVNDDLESLFENIRLGKEPDEKVYTYFLPKLTEEELELVERRDTSYLQTFNRGNYADVDETEMMLSESDSKYVRGESRRRTFVIENPSETSSEIDKQSCLKNCCNCSLQ